MDVDLSDPTLGRARDALACGNCGNTLLRLPLTGHYGRGVDLDLCGACHLVWFDTAESARLPGTALLELLGAMARLQDQPHRTLREQACCPRCQGPLKPVHNRSRWGATLQLECRRGHGAWQTFAQFLAEKGLVRPLTSADRARLHVDCACLNCGAPLGERDRDCSYCGSVPGLFDVARMARSLDPEGAVEATRAPRFGLRRHGYNCHACGAAVRQVPAIACPQCGTTLACTDLHRAHQTLRSLEPALLAHQQRPAPQVIARRLDCLRRDLPRRREWLRDLQRDANTPVEPDSSFWSWLVGLLARRLD